MLRSGRQRALGGIGLAIAVAGCAACLAHPINTGVTRTLLLAAVALAVALALWLCWPRRSARVVMLSLIAAPLIWLALPARSLDRAGLRHAYVQSLRAYLGTTYVWGGENRRGIDCSGLVRAGLRDATARTAMRRCDPGMARQALAIWWNDCSARELGRGYGDRCAQVAVTPSLHAMDLSQLLPGDLAVTANGAHVLAYLGGRLWISADPSAAAVIIDEVGTSTNGYMSVPMTIVRWEMLSEPERESSPVSTLVAQSLGD